MFLTLFYLFYLAHMYFLQSPYHKRINFIIMFSSFSCFIILHHVISKCYFWHTSFKISKKKSFFMLLLIYLLLCLLGDSFQFLQESDEGTYTNSFLAISNNGASSLATPFEENFILGTYKPLKGVNFRYSFGTFSIRYWYYT